MSADSPRRLSRKGSAGNVVLPQPVSDPSLIDSVAGFIHEVIPQAYSSVLPGDSRESIAWARFEQADYNDPALFPDSADDCDSTAPLLLVLGYGNGVQVWNIPASGEAVEVLSWNQRVVRTLRFLPQPERTHSHAHSPADPFAHSRPLIAIVDNAGPPPHFCTVSFISLHSGDQVKSIKFKNPICDVLANRRSIVITFVERIAVFDALTLEDRLTVTTCYPSPGICQNPVSLGLRWLAFGDKRLVSWWRSVGGCESDISQSYTATMLHAAKSLGKGLRGLSGQVASSLSAAAATKQPTSIQPSTLNGAADASTPGVVTILDIEGNINAGGGGSGVSGGGGLGEQIVAHFVAHSEPVVALAFDPTGTLLLTADHRGHRFHLFRIQPHLSGSTLCQVHQLYTLYRGDTTARIQDITFSSDSRWVAVSSLRGTTHVFPITPYGGSIGVRTHTTPHVVNKLSRFHRSAGLLDREGGRNSPVMVDGGTGGGGSGPPLTPPLPLRPLPQPHALTVQPLAQLRHQATTTATTAATTTMATATEEATVRLAAMFAPPRACLPPSHSSHSNPVAPQPPLKRRALDSIYVMSSHGNLIQYDLEPRHVSGVSKDRISDDTAIELLVEPKAEWIVMNPPLFNPIQPPLSSSNPLLMTLPLPSLLDMSSRHANCIPPTKLSSHNHDEHWLSQVEIVTHAGPHRRLWMGPQFIFKTYSLSSSDLDKDSVEVGTMPVQSNPINVPMRPPLLIESGSTSSLEQSPHLTEVYQNEFEFSLDHGESRLREDLADAMQESPNTPGRRWSVLECGGVGGEGGGGGGSRNQSTHVQKPSVVLERRVNPLGTYIMMVEPPSNTKHEDAATSSSSGRRHSNVGGGHLIVVAAQSARSAKQQQQQIGEHNKSRNESGTNEKCVSTNILPSCIDNSDVTSIKHSIRVNEICDINEKLVVNRISNEEKIKTPVGVDGTSDVNEKSLANKVNNKERRKNAKNDRNRPNKSTTIGDTKCGDVAELIDVEFPSLDDCKHRETSAVVLESSALVISGSKSSKRRSKNATRNAENVSTCEEKLSVSCVIDEQQLGRKFDDDCCIEPYDKVIEISQEIVEDLKISEVTDKLPELQVHVVASDNDVEKHCPSIFDLADEPIEVSQPDQLAVVKDKEYPTLSSSVIVKTKRKCRTLGKKISKFSDDKGNNKPVQDSGNKNLVDEIDLLDCQQLKCDRNLMDFPDLLLSNVKIVDDSKANDLIEESRESSIAQVVIETIEKDNLMKADSDVKYEETSTPKPTGNDETTDKDSSDDATCSSKSEPSKGANHKKRKPNRKQKENNLCIIGNKASGEGGLSDSDTNLIESLTKSVVVEVEHPSDAVQTTETVVVEQPKKLSWSQITSLGKKTNSDEGSRNRKHNMEEVEVVEELVEDENRSRQEVEQIIQPELISWKCVEKESASKTNSTEDRGSVYESCSESVEDGEHQNQAQLIEVADEAAEEATAAVEDATADIEEGVAYQLCPVYSSEKDSGDSASKESADSGEKDAQLVAKKSRKQRKKRR